MKKTIIGFFLVISLCFSQEYSSGDHELFLMPTAYTMQKGNSYITSYELFLYNYSVALTPRTHIGMFTLFPITDQFLNTITLGFKQNYYRSEKFSTALYGTYTPHGSGFTLGTTISIGEPSNSFHLSVAYSDFEDGPNHDFIYMLGYRIDASETISFMVEYTNAQSTMEHDFNGLISAGIRLRSGNLSLELAGMRPLESTGDLLLLPLLKGTYYFQ